MRVAIAALIALVLLLPGPAAAQVVDLSTIKCKEFLDSSKETISYIMMWLDGYFTGEDAGGFVKARREMSERDYVNFMRSRFSK